MRSERRYTDNERAVYVELLIAAGWPDRKGALAASSRRSGVPMSTLLGWARATRNPPPANARIEKRFDLQVAIRAELEAIFEAMNTKRDEASYKDLTVAAGILTEKDQLLAGGATNRTELVEAAAIVRSRVDSLAARITAGGDFGAVSHNGNGTNGASL